jgi:hypothetical protein
MMDTVRAVLGEFNIKTACVLKISARKELKYATKA